MENMRRCALAATVLLALAVTQGFAGEEKEGLVDNPYYKGWANFKPGARVLLHEKTVHSDGSTDERTVEYRLLKVMPKRLMVHTAVIEKELLSLVESAPTKVFYPAKVHDADIKAALLDADAKKGMETIKVLGKDIECSTFEVHRKTKTEEIKNKVWRSTTVPGGVVQRVRSLSQDGKLVATTTTTLQAYGDGQKKAKEEKKVKDEGK